MNILYKIYAHFIYSSYISKLIIFSLFNFMNIMTFKTKLQ